MDKILESRLSKVHILILCLCLGSLVLCEFIDQTIGWSVFQNVAEPGRMPDNSHFDEHEDDFVLMKEAAANLQAVAILEKSIHLTNSSHASSPLLPPPKAG